MAKIKTHSGAKKRFKKLASGKIKYTQSFRRHLLTKKTSKLKRALRQSAYFSTSDIGHIRPLLPY